jgi:hypothetical protein
MKGRLSTLQRMDTLKRASLGVDNENWSHAFFILAILVLFESIL